VPIFSAVGGDIQNLPTGTALLWTPAIAGVEAISAVEADMTGATTATFPGALKRLALFDRLGLGKANMSAEVFRSKVGAFPAGVLAWVGAPKGQALNRDSRERFMRFRLHVICGRVDSNDSRTDEGDTILDYAEGLMENQADIDGEIFASPGIEVGESGFVLAEDGSTVHYLDLDVPHTIEHIERRTFVDFLEVQQTLVTAPDAEYPDPASMLVVVDLGHDMTP